MRFLTYKNGGVEQVPKGQLVGQASDIGNGSNVSGASIADALNTLQKVMADNQNAGGLKNDSNVAGASIADALNTLNAKLDALENI